MKHVTKHFFVLGVTLAGLVMGGSVAPVALKAQEVEPVGRPIDAEAIRASKNGALVYADSGWQPLEAENEAPTLVNVGDTDNRIVFQSYRDGNWEIYAALGDGSGSTRLTFDSSVADVSPKLRYGSIVATFRSVNSNGDSQIMTVLKDGTRYRGHLSTGRYLDLQWSPDGRKLAYSKATNTNFYDVFVADYNFIDETLTGEICLTCGSGVSSMEPTWSPDGTQLIYMRRNSSRATGQIWQMSATGQNPQPRSGDLWYLQNLVWSPDGMQLAFDAAINQDSWNQLRVMNLATNAITLVHSPDKDLVEAWMGDWSPDGAQLYFTRVEYAVQGGQLVLGNTWIERIASSGGTPSRLTGNTGRDMQPSIEKRDLIAPSSRVRPLAKFVGQTSALLSSFPAVKVDEPEPGGSELAMKYDNQTRLVPDIELACRYGINGDWNLNSKCVDRMGETVYFRSRAKDNEGNLEAWPIGPDYDAATTFYASSIYGSITDNRGYPISRASVNFQPTEFFSVETSTGQYQFLFASKLVSSALISKSGFSSLPPLRLVSLFGPTHTFQSYMYSGENVIQNGNLDDFSILNDSITYPGWVTNRIGNSPSGPHSGQGFAAFNGGLGDIPPSMSQLITVPTHAAMPYPTLAFLYRYDRVFPVPADPVLAVSVSNGVTTTVNLPGSFAAGRWVMKWMDMQAWAGQSVTLTFALSGTSNQGVFIGLDAISLTSWLTPVPTQTSLTQLPANAPATQINITGTNFIATPTVKLNGSIALGNVQWLTETQLIADLPANLPLGIYDLWVTNPGGQESVLQNAIMVGQQLYLPLARKDE
jgi:Tol biopolymer transport system component